MSKVHNALLSERLKDAIIAAVPPDIFIDPFELYDAKTYNLKRELLMYIFKWYSKPLSQFDVDLVAATRHEEYLASLKNLPDEQGDISMTDVSEDAEWEEVEEIQQSDARSESVPSDNHYPTSSRTMNHSTASLTRAPSPSSDRSCFDTDSDSDADVDGDAEIEVIPNDADDDVDNVSTCSTCSSSSSSTADEMDQSADTPANDISSPPSSPPILSGSMPTPCPSPTRRTILPLPLPTQTLHRRRYGGAPSSPTREDPLSSPLSCPSKYSINNDAQSYDFAHGPSRNYDEPEQVGMDPDEGTRFRMRLQAAIANDLEGT